MSAPMTASPSSSPLPSLPGMTRQPAPRGPSAGCRVKSGNDDGGTPITDAMQDWGFAVTLGNYGKGKKTPISQCFSGLVSCR